VRSSSRYGAQTKDVRLHYGINGGGGGGGAINALHRDPFALSSPARSGVNGRGDVDDSLATSMPPPAKVTMASSSSGGGDKDKDIVIRIVVDRP
jgi:hypothetical protein